MIIMNYEIRKKLRKIPIKRHLVKLRKENLRISDVYKVKYDENGNRNHKPPFRKLFESDFIDYCLDPKGLGLSHRDIAYIFRCGAGTISRIISDQSNDKLEESMFDEVDYREELFGTLIAELDLKGTYETENVFLMISDLQAGSLVTASGFDMNPKETINTYFDRLIEKLSETVIRRNLKINTLNIVLLGDLVDGWKIFPQQFTIPLRQQKEIVVLNILRLIRFVVENITPSVHLYGAYGNHGTNSRYHIASDNWDVIAMDEISVHMQYLKEYSSDYDLIKDFTSDREVQFHEIGGHRYCIQHGHQFGGFNTESWKRQAKDLHIAQGGFDALLMGHWHQKNWLETQGFDILVNGCTYRSEFVQWKLQGLESITQLLFGADEHNAIAWVESLDVDQGILLKEDY